MPSRDNSISDAWASGPGAKPRASELLAEAQAHERSGRISEALDAYHVARRRMLCSRKHSVA